MNQAQRTFLINKIKEQVKLKIESLRNSKPEAPNLSNYLFHAVMTNTLKLQSEEHIMDVVKKKALNAKSGENWLSNKGMGWGKENSISIKPSDLFIIPDAFTELDNKYREECSKINEEICILSLQADGLITRIQLASDKTLQRMINEVDDMGDISLIETKLKLIN